MVTSSLVSGNYAKLVWRWLSAKVNRYCRIRITGPYLFPLYIYSYADRNTIGLEQERVTNLDEKTVKKIADNLDIPFSEENNKGTFCPIDLLDYVYAVLYSPSYREKYKEFLKIDFPRIPYLENLDTFLALVKLGGELRQIHLLETDAVENYITSYPQDGSNEVSRKIVKKDWELYDIKNQFGRVWINDDQYFEKIPLKSWEFYIGGYQPAQKWLKDRIGRKLGFDDILHYQKIIVALNETDRIMHEIDKIDFC